MTKPIDLSRVKRTRDGREVSQLVRFWGTSESKPIFGVVEGVSMVQKWSLDGRADSHHACHIDLVEEPEKRWVNLYWDGEGMLRVSDQFFRSELATCHEEFIPPYKKCRAVEIEIPRGE